MADIPVDEPRDAPPLNSELLVFRIAREIARNLVPIDMICERFKIDEDQYNSILRSPIFQRRLEEELDIWNASTPLAIAERIKAKAGTMIEEALLEVYELIHDKNQPMVAKVRALEWASRMAGIGEVVPLGNLPPGVTNGAGPGLNFNIFINNEKVSFQQPADVKTVEGTAVLVDKEPI
jgi:hypothetical protein